MPRDYLFKDGDERPIPGLRWKAAGVIALAVLALATAGWEIAVRSRGYEPSYIDWRGLWSIERHRATEVGSQGAVIIGSSRILFDTDLPTFSKETGLETVQLASYGTNPRFHFRHLAQDTTITGLVVVGVTPGLFYAPYGGRFGDVESYYQTESPSQRAGQRLSMLLESQLAFIDDQNLPLFTLIERIRMPNREGADDPWIDVFKLSNTTRYRQSKMWERVRTDSAYGHHARLVWKTFIDRGAGKKGPTGDTLKTIFDEVKDGVGRIRARGGDVVFVRCPSTGPYRETEHNRFPRAVYWDSLLTYVDAAGVHFEDYPEMQGLEVPEWSHLAADEAPVFTRAYARAIMEQLKKRESNVFNRLGSP